MGVRDVVGGGPLGFPSVGLALPLSSGSFRTLCRSVGQATQEDNRVGLAAALQLVRRWYPEREIVAVADCAYASLRLLDRCRKLRKPMVGSTGRCNTLGFGCCPDRRCMSGEAGSSWRVVCCRQEGIVGAVEGRGVHQRH